MNYPEHLASLMAFKSGKLSPDEAMYDTPNLLGNESYGYAYEFGERVYKVTTSISEAIYALKMKNLDMEHAADIFNVHVFENDKSLYFVIEQELINTADNEKAIEPLTEAIEHNQMDYSYPAETIIETLQAKDVGLNESDKKVIHDVCDMYDELLVNGFFNTDLHVENLGLKPDGTVCCFDQMDTMHEQDLEDQFLDSRDIFSVLERNCPMETLQQLRSISPSELELIHYIEEISELFSDVKFAFDTNEAYEFLPNGDWGAGGCKEFAYITQEIINEFASENDFGLPKAKISKVCNTETQKTEHYFVQIGSLCIDSDGLNSTHKFLADFIQNNALHLSLDALEIAHENDNNPRFEISDFDGLRRLVKEYTHMDAHCENRLTI